MVYHAFLFPRRDWSQVTSFLNSPASVTLSPGESSFPLSGLVPEQMFYFKSVTFKSEEIAIPRSLLTTALFPC